MRLSHALPLSGGVPDEIFWAATMAVQRAVTHDLRFHTSPAVRFVCFFMTVVRG